LAGTLLSGTSSAFGHWGFVGMGLFSLIALVFSVAPFVLPAYRFLKGHSY
jgi:hypothetical protein